MEEGQHTLDQKSGDGGEEKERQDTTEIPDNRKETKGNLKTNYERRPDDESVEEVR